MRVYSLYKDFFLFLESLVSSHDRWSAFQNSYFSKHRDFLSKVWFCFQGYTLKNIRQRVELIKREDYADIADALAGYDIEENTRRVIEHCIRLLTFADQRAVSVYLFIGFFSPDAFVIRFQGDYVICVALERFHSFRAYPLLLAHELGHCIQNRLNGERFSTPLHRLVREGIAICFSKRAYPGKREHEYLFLTESRFRFFEENYERLACEIFRGGAEGVDLFHGGCERFPPRTGYYVGYRVVSDFLTKRCNNSVECLIRSSSRILKEMM